MEKGYFSNSPDAYPHRVLDSGVNGALKIYLRRTANESLDNSIESLNGFKVLLHTPGEIPRLTKKYFRISMKKHFLINIRPQMMTTSKGLDHYDPDKRQCYLHKEKQLKFFKIYTQSNCELECLSNFTARICKCVHFSMPRNNSTKICLDDKWGCPRKARKQFSRKMLEESLKPKSCGSEDDLSCECLPSCTSIEFDTEISHDEYPYDKINDALNITVDSRYGKKENIFKVRLNNLSNCFFYIVVHSLLVLPFSSRSLNLSRQKGRSCMA
jgi:acid-sensing ion channel, other